MNYFMYGRIRVVAAPPAAWAALFAALVTLVGGCAATVSSDSAQRRADGSYELKCRSSLSRCLDKADELCRGTRYKVLNASDNRDYMGTAGLAESEVRTSEAVIRCGPRGTPLFGSGDKASPVTAPEAQPAPVDTTPGAPACVPGTTQMCVGPAGCRGGQQCLRDRSGFTPCDCGGIAAPDSARPSAPDAARPSAPDSRPPSAPDSAPPSVLPGPPESPGLPPR